jgi:spermidine synthase
MEDLWNIWFSELHRKSAGLTVKIKDILFSGKSDFQRIEVFDTEVFGKVLVLYGSIMISERDEFIYHEMITHVPLNVHPAPESVLVVGGGDGGTVREVLKHKDVKKVKVVEIDRMVVEVCKRFFPEISGGFDDPKVEIVYNDGARFMAETGERFDVVIIDSSDPVGPAEVLFQRQFYENVYRKLKEDGIMVAQTESPFYDREAISKIYRSFKQIFPIVSMYIASIPTYPSGLWSFGFCSKRFHPIHDFRGTKVDCASLRYYNPDVHVASFKLPNFIKELVE